MSYIEMIPTNGEGEFFGTYLLRGERIMRQLMFFTSTIQAL